MMTKLRAVLCCLAAAWACTGGTPAADAQAAKRPNIVIILTDDMGFSDIGCYGSEIATPNLDKLAANAIRFTQFYNTARCCPTRASLLTGLYPHQAAVGHMMEDKSLDGYTGDLSKKAVTIAEVLKTAGYGTYCVGKWHVTRHDAPAGPKHNWPLQRGFDRCYGTIRGGGNYYDPAALLRDNTMISPAADAEYKPESYYYTDAISEHAVRFIGDHCRQQPGKPFFLYVAYTAAHWPMHAPESEVAKYKGKYDAGYDAIRNARFERLKSMGLIQPAWDLSPQFGHWDNVENKPWEARCMEVYAAMVDRMDQGVGRIIAALQKNEQLDNTLVLYLQDNGGCAEGVGREKNAAKRQPKEPAKADEILLAVRPTHCRDGRPVRTGYGVMPGPDDTFVAYGEAWANVSNTPFRYYKHFVHEGGISTPLIAHWPAGIKRRGALEHQPGHLIDIMATCVDLAGAKYPAEFGGNTIQPMEGRSLVPAFDGKPIEREALFWEHEGKRALRAGTFKLVAKGPQGPWELYDMEKDRTEMHDLAAQQPERVKEMTALWEKWAQRTKALPWPWGKPYGGEGKERTKKEKRKEQ